MFIIYYVYACMRVLGCRATGHMSSQRLIYKNQSLLLNVAPEIELRSLGLAAILL